MLFAHCRGIYFRHLDEFGDPVFTRAPDDCLRQIGMLPQERLLPYDNRVFRGFDLLHELFMFPHKFLGFRLTGLRQVMTRIPARKADILFAFDRSGAFVASGRAPLDFSALAPGDESPFVVNVPNVSDVARYRVTFRSGNGVVRHIDRRTDQVQLAQAVR